MEKGKIIILMLFFKWSLKAKKRHIFYLKKITLIIVLLSLPLLGFSQNSYNNVEKLKLNKELYASVNKFYNTLIQQETKDQKGKVSYLNTIQIKSVNYLDYNEDGIKDAFIEFMVSTTDLKGDNHVSVAVLFKNVKRGYKYIAHMNPNNTTFTEYSKSIFYFSGEMVSFSEGVVTEKYLLRDNKFIRK